ncbi:carotenoid ester lipase precursor [Vararia minispora EC-137]|uniref:Carotenoid ester lipase n=1 Tax=Vararia minispora EC-137 TaxID=1314806 RepID=A0ACB8Q9U3_9AGAM|nr:carotenoid ester lipase precursor [Vararia minispora EC-137]
MRLSSRIRSTFLALYVACFGVLVKAQAGAPTITLDRGVFTGVSMGSTNAFLGIPFAKPPIGDLRLRLPQAIDPYDGLFNVTAFGNSCILQNVTASIPFATINPLAVPIVENLLSLFPTVSESEDCLFVNVFAPANATGRSQLPVMVWIYASGFESGSSTVYDGTAYINRSIELDSPVLFVSMNYRCVLLPLGFPGGQEAKDAKIANLGLHDQRLAMRWVQRYISAFGGDPAKVTIFGESAGATSVVLHLLTNDGDTEGLFRAAIVDSNLELATTDGVPGQKVFDEFARNAGCGDALRSLAVFDCLRMTPLDTIRNATDPTPGVLSYNWGSVGWRPFVDGVFLTAPPMRLISQGRVADVPFIIGDAEDEGTMLSVSSTNVTTDGELRSYLLDSALASFNASNIELLLELYPSDPAAGSPFDTGEQNALTPEFKRMAALLGDAELHAPRRLLLQQQSGKQNAYSYLYSRGKNTPYLGSCHGCDLSVVFGPGDLTDVFIRFAATLDPNGALEVDWPRYTPSAPRLFRLLDGDVPFEIVNDTFRVEEIKTLISIELGISA